MATSKEFIERLQSGLESKTIASVVAYDHGSPVRPCYLHIIKSSGTTVFALVKDPVEFFEMPTGVFSGIIADLLKSNAKIYTIVAEVPPCSPSTTQ